MTQHNYNEILNKLNQILSDFIHKKNVPSFLSIDIFGNTIWKLKMGKMSIGFCFFSYSNILPFNDIIIPVKIKHGNQQIYENLNQFKKGDYCIKGYQTEIINRFKNLLNKLIITNKTDIISKKMISYN